MLNSQLLVPEWSKIAKEAFQHLLKLGIIRPSLSSWTSLLHKVPKKTAAILHGATIFWKQDVICAYHQIPVDPSDVPKTVLITPFGLFKFVWMPFGLWNVAQTFQHFMDQVLYRLTFAYNYIDDLLTISEEYEECKIHLHIVFKCLQDHRILIKSSKWELGVPQLQVLGHQIDSQRIKLRANASVQCRTRYRQSKSFPNPQ